MNPVHLPNKDDPGASRFGRTSPFVPNHPFVLPTHQHIQEAYKIFQLNDARGSGSSDIQINYGSLAQFQQQQQHNKMLAQMEQDKKKIKGQSSREEVPPGYPMHHRFQPNSNGIEAMNLFVDGVGKNFALNGSAGNSTSSFIMDDRDFDQEKKRHRVPKACLYCQKSHMSCDVGRPCKRCTERGMSDLCTDGDSKRKSKKRGSHDIPETPDVSGVTGEEHTQNTSEFNASGGNQSQPTVYIKSEEQSHPETSKTALVPISQAQQAQQVQHGFFGSFDDAGPSSHHPTPVEIAEARAVAQQIQQQHQQAQANHLQQQAKANTAFAQQQPSFVQQPHPNRFAPQPNGNFGPPTQNYSMHSNNDQQNFARIQSEQQQLHQHHQQMIVKANEAFRQGQSTFETPSILTNYTWTAGYIDAIRKRLSTQESELFANRFLGIREELLMCQQNLTKEAVRLILQDFDMYLNVFRNTFDQVSVPTIIWEQIGVIHYANGAYREMTGFSQNTPTPRENFSIVQEFSPPALREYISRTLDLFANTEMASMMFSGGVLLRGNAAVQASSSGTSNIDSPNSASSPPQSSSSDNNSPTISGASPASVSTTSASNSSGGRSNLSGQQVSRERFVEGTICVSVKRDFIGFPLLFVGHFMPTLRTR
eukprot:TRINITY_DN1951_c0_g1_i1.p1 TRINITY_DN1951_c0_g1~~TRINITY_DN1951_c0_g1_i1.p1  ORF type:complete len:649 (-),score=121.09 TRINITY_DN1951_c0_g1_i1:103-2049(-)